MRHTIFIHTMAWANRGFRFLCDLEPAVVRARVMKGLPFLTENGYWALVEAMLWAKAMGRR